MRELIDEDPSWDISKIAQRIHFRRSSTPQEWEGVVGQFGDDEALVWAAGASMGMNDSFAVVCNLPESSDDGWDKAHFAKEMSSTDDVIWREYLQARGFETSSRTGARLLVDFVLSRVHRDLWSPRMAADVLGTLSGEIDDVVKLLPAGYLTPDEGRALAAIEKADWQESDVQIVQRAAHRIEPKFPRLR